MSAKPTNYDEYFAGQSELAQARLTELVACLTSEVPNGKVQLKWGKPALVTDNIVCVFATFKKHISLHPTPSIISHFADELSQYTTSGNTVQFPLDNPLPIELIHTMIKRRHYEQTQLDMGWK